MAKISKGLCKWQTRETLRTLSQKSSVNYPSPTSNEVLPKSDCALESFGRLLQITVPPLNQLNLNLWAWDIGISNFWKSRGGSNVQPELRTIGFRCHPNLAITPGSFLPCSCFWIFLWSDLSTSTPCQSTQPILVSHFLEPDLKY